MRRESESVSVSGSGSECSHSQPLDALWRLRTALFREESKSECTSQRDLRSDANGDWQPSVWRPLTPLTSSVTLRAPVVV